jgi:hypothetical protein
MNKNEKKNVEANILTTKNEIYYKKLLFLHVYIYKKQKCF